MAFDVSSWFLEQLESRNSTVKREFYIGTSDYSTWVTKYPSFTRTANDLRSVNITIDLANENKEFNNFFHYTYTIPNTCTLKLGFTHPTSGDEMISLFTGFLKNVKYNDKENKRVCSLRLRDRLWDFTERKVGDSDNPVDIGSTIPSDIAWTLCTCYGGLDTTQGSNNTDIDYDAFIVWANQFSTDTVLMSAHYEGKKVAEALNRLGVMTDSAIYIEGDGKLTFKKFIEPNSLDQTFTRDDFLDLTIDVESTRLVNKHYTYFDYSVESDYWQKSIFQIDSLSVDSFGLREDFIKDETIWHVDSIGAINLSGRKVNLLSDPPKSFEVVNPLYGLTRNIGETIRLVDSFYEITSSSGWRIVEIDYNMHDTETTFKLDEATVMNAFYLDVSTLDGTHLLL